MAIGKLPDSDTDGAEGVDAIFADINITPLTDIFLVLLIIFTVGSTIQVQKMRADREEEKSSGLKVNLPSGAAKEIDTGRNSIVISIQVDGTLAVNGRPITDHELDGALQSAFSADKNTQVVLQADAGVNHGRVVGVMERAKSIGLHRLAIATQGGP